MKHSILKIAAFIAGVFLVGCQVDTTSTPNTNVDGKTTLSISLESSRTALGEKVGEEYPVVWSEGDRIIINGVASSEAAIDPATPNRATFEILGELSMPYYITYPYSEEFVGTTPKVVFPAEQVYAEGTFAQNHAPMCGYVAKQGDKVVLEHLSGVLRFPVKAASNGAVLEKIVITSTDGIKLSGEFSVDCEKYSISASASATNQITLDCGSGVELSQDEYNPTKFWFVVPGGFTFSEGFNITVIFNDNTYFKKSTTKQIGIERNHIKPMAPFKPEGIKPNGPIRYKYNSGNKEEAFSLKNTFYAEDGSALDIVDQVYDEETGEWVVLLSGILKTIGGNSFNESGSDIEYIKVDNNDESVKVDGFAFYNCTADDLIILNDVDEINESAFTGSTITDLNISGDVTTIKNSAGTGSSIENINITGSAKIIEDQAFSGCGDLQTININNVETIGYRAFYKCGSLTGVNVPGVKYVEAGAFRECSNLETITLDSVVEIDDNAFMDCSKLTSVVISENCTMIGEGAFCNAINLQEVYCYAVNPPFIKTDNRDGSYVFDNVHPDICVYIPMGSWDIYTDDEYFVGHDYEDPNIDAETNWWYEEYEDYLYEIED